MKNIDLKNIFKKEVKTGDLGPAVAWPVNFVRDWKIIVLIFAVGLISLSLFAWRIYLSNKIAGGYLAPAIETSGANIKTVDIKRLDADLQILKNRQSKYLELKTGRSKRVDPSL